MDFDKKRDEVLDNIDNEKSESEEMSFATDFSEIDSKESQSEEIEDKEEIEQEPIDSPVIEIASMDSLVSTENVEAVYTKKEEIGLNPIAKTLDIIEENDIVSKSIKTGTVSEKKAKPESRYNKKPEDKGGDSGDPVVKKRKLIILITIVVGLILIAGAVIATMLLNSDPPPEPTETPIDTYTVTYTSGDAYSIVPLDSNDVESGSDYSFRVDVNSGYAGDYMIVRAGGDIIIPVDGIYTLTNVNSDISITVEGVMYIALETEFTYADNYIGGILNGKKITGSSVTRSVVMLPSSVGGVPITGIGGSAFVNNSTISVLAIPDSIIIIEEYAFFGTTRLSRVYLPDSLTTIEAYAFASSELLSEVVYPENPSVLDIGDNAFQNCDSMTVAEIPHSVTLLGDSVFSHSDGIFTLTLDNPVIEDTEYLFSECTGLITVTVEGEALSLPYGIFSGCVALQSVIIETGVTSIGDYALTQSGITSITLPDTLNSIGVYAFSECSSLSAVSFNEGLTSIGNSAFYACPSLENLSFPSTLISIGSLSFALCDNLSDISFVFQGALNSIGNGAFAGKQNISGTLMGNGNKIGGISLPATVNALGDYAFSYCADMTTASIPGSIGLIGQYVFYNCDSLSDVTLGQGITDIGNYAFAGTSALIGITLPTTLITLSDRAFYDSGLTSITIPMSVTSIGAYCFAACDLSSVIFEEEAALSIGNYAFYNCASLTSVSLPSALATLGNYSFSSTGLTSITIPASLDAIGNYAFSSCRSMTTATIRSGVSSIGAGAFDSCAILRLINIPASVTSIGRNAFRSTRWLLTESSIYLTDLNGEKYIVVNGILIYHRSSSTKELELPSGISRVNDYAFEDEDDVIDITIPVNVNSIGTFAFYDCPKLRVVYMSPSSPPTLGNSAFNTALRFFIVQDEYVDAFTENNTVAGWTDAYKAKVYSDALTEQNGFWTDGTILEGYTGEETDITVPYGITVIAEGAFRDNQDITSVTLPESLIEIEDYAFYNCINLVTVSAPASLERIGNYAFALCASLSNFNIASESALNYIGDYAFAGTHYEGETLLGTGNLLSSFIIPAATSHIGEGAFRGSGLTSIIIPATVIGLSTGIFEDNQSLVSATVSDGITVIPDRTFTGCISLENLSLPSSIQTIGAHAFSDCVALTAFTAPTALQSIGNSAFKGDIVLVTLSLNSVLQSIGESAFMNCALTALTLPDSLITLGESAFRDCVSLLSAIIGTDLYAVPDYAFYGCALLESVNVPVGIAFIGDYAFYGCAALNSIDISVVNYIGEYAFMGADILSEVILSEGITEILEGAFYDCDAIEILSLPDSLESIGDYAFFDCDSLYELSVSEDSDLETIGDYAFHGASRLMGANFAYKLSYIGDYAFALCNELESITFDPGSVLSYIGDYAFAGEYFVEIEEDQWEKLGSGNQLVSFTLPSFVTSVGNYTFFSCKHLETIELLGSLSSIGDYAFGGCSLLTDFDIPEYLTSIGVEAFADCDRLTSLTLGSDDINAEPLFIGDRAFKGSGGVVSVRFERNVQSIGKEAFSDLESLVAFEVSSNNMYYKAVDGVLFNVSGTKLIQYPASKPSAEYEIPSSINSIPASLQEIGAYAFINVYRLTSITFATGGAVQTIREGAFNGCISLASIEIPSTVTVIEKGAFGNCGSLTNVRMLSDIPPILKSKNEPADENEEAVEVFVNTPLNAIFVETPTAYTNFNSASEENGWTAELKALLYQFSMLTPEGFLIQNTTLINYVGDGGEIVIPSEITAVADNVFRNKNVTGVSGGDNVETIGAGAFYGTEWLETLVDTAIIGSVLIKHSDTDSAILNEGITEIYEGAFQNMSNLTSITLPSSLLKVGNSAFFGCSGLNNVTIPANVQEIGQFAFMNCSRLTGIYVLPITPPVLGAYAFDWSPVQAIYVDSTNEVYYSYINDVWNYYSGIIYRNNIISVEGFALLGSSLVHYAGSGGDIVLPSSVVSIDSYAFTMNQDITSITIPSSVNSIGAYAFKGAIRLGTITFLGSTAPAQVGADIYLNTIITAVFVPDGALTAYTAVNAQGWDDAIIRESGDISEGFLIEDNVLINYSGSASTVTVPVGVQAIGAYAFGGRLDISVINLPENVGTISEHAFDLCYGLTAINVNASNMSFSSDVSGVLYNRSKTELVKYPAGKPDATYSLNAAVIAVSSRAFYNADNLTSITLTGDVDSVGQYAFYDCDGLTDIILGDSVSVLDSYSFASCDNLINIDFGGGVGEIRSRAFDGCVSLASIELPESLTFIGAYAFNNNRTLATVVTASALNNIGEYAFFNCVNLNTVTLLTINPPILGTGAFMYNKSGAGYMIMPSLAIYVPDERVTAYQTASVWSEYEAYIIAVSAAEE